MPFVSLFPARQVLNVDSDILINQRLGMHVLHNCTTCGYKPHSDEWHKEMVEYEVKRHGNMYYFITSCNLNWECLEINKGNAEILKNMLKQN